MVGWARCTRLYSAGCPLECRVAGLCLFPGIRLCFLTAGSELNVDTIRSCCLVNRTALLLIYYTNVMRSFWSFIFVLRMRDCFESHVRDLTSTVTEGAQTILKFEKMLMILCLINNRFCDVRENEILLSFLKLRWQMRCSKACTSQTYIIRFDQTRIV